MAASALFCQILVMKPQTKEFLYFLLWCTDKLARPTFRNLTDSYEGWAYRNNLLRQVAVLEQQKLVERNFAEPGDRLYRLTSQGRLFVLGGRDPQARWSRKWDGHWRVVLFDIPSAQDSYRRKLRRYLHGHGFGYLQNSVWITPDSLEEERRVLVDGKVNVESLILMEARPCAGESDAEIVAGAWDFKRINNSYARHLEILGERPGGPLKSKTASKAFRRWAAAEREAWLNAVTNDPLLPERILPAGYLGQQAWRQRREVFQEAGRQLRTFNLQSD
jgi:DNA-binding transcriptional regulator PaaX